MTDDIQAILGELSDSHVIGAVHVDIDTILSVQKQIQKLAALHSDYANCPTNKRTNTTIGPKFAKALATFNKQFGTASDGGTITDSTLTALKSDKVKSAINSNTFPTVSSDGQALIELATAQTALKAALDEKARAVTAEDKTKTQAKVSEAAAAVTMAATRVINTTDDSATKQTAENAKSAASDAVGASTPQQAVDATNKVADVGQQIRSEVVANPSSAAVTNVSFLDVLKRQYGLLPLWGWGLVGSGAVVILHMLLGRLSPPVKEDW